MPARGVGLGLQAVEAVEDAGLAEAFDQIDPFEPAGEVGGRLRRNHAQVWNSLGVVHLSADNVEFRAPERQQLGLWRSGLGPWATSAAVGERRLSRARATSAVAS